MPEWKDKAAELAWKYVNSINCHVFLTGREGVKGTFDARTYAIGQVLCDKQK